jgi:hypothetical protein
MDREFIISRGKKLNVHRLGSDKFAYDNSGTGGCCTIIAERIEGEIKIYTLCAKPLYGPAVDAGLMGCRVTCEQHLREYFKNQTLEEAIAQKIEYTRKINAGELICDVCGAKGARPCPGEGQTLCNKCNTRKGINRWS